MHVLDGVEKVAPDDMGGKRGTKTLVSPIHVCNMHFDVLIFTR